MRRTSGIRRGVSRNREPEGAARELSAQLLGANTEAAIFFCSVQYDLEALGSALAARFGGVEMIGCTTAGEIATDGYTTDSIVGVSFPSDNYIVVAEHCDELGVASLVGVRQIVQSLLRKLRLRAPGATARDTVAVLLIDGLSGIEEPILSAIGRELDGIPLVGASAGDSLRFRETVIFHGGELHDRSAVLVLIHTCVPFEVFRTQHIVSSDVKMVITEADPMRRVVTEINAEPACAEYARQLGMHGQRLNPRLLATHPVVVRIGGDDYARSIQKVNEDGSLTFYSAIEEGLVLAAGRETNILRDLERLFARIRGTIGVPTAVLGFDCIFRRLELQERRLEWAASRLLSANNVVGFSTYGEQFHGMHLNQTFSGVAFGGAAGRS